MRTETEEIRDNLKYLSLLARDYPSQAAAASEIISGDLNVRQAEALCKKLAKGPAPEKAVPPRAALPVEVESSLREVIGNEVKVDYKRGGKGTLTLHFYNDSQLVAFANLLGGYRKEGQ